MSLHFSSDPIALTDSPTFPGRYITIHWTRHAESCSNFKGANFRDENLYPTRPAGYKELTPEAKKILKGKTSDIQRQVTTITSKISPKVLRNIALYHPNLSFVGMQQAILLGSKFVRNPKENPGSYDVVFVSPSLRTIMTSLLAFRGTNQRIIVIPFIVEHLNISGKFDNVNPPLALDKLKKYVAFVKDWLDENWIENFDDIEIMTLLHKINSTIKNIVSKTSETNIRLAWEQGLQNFKCWRTTKYCSSKPIPAGCPHQIKTDCQKIINCKKDETRTNCQHNPGDIQPPYSAITYIIERILLINYTGLHKLSQNGLPSVKKLLNDIIKLGPELPKVIQNDFNIKKSFERLQKIMDPSYTRGPAIDFTWVEKYWKTPEYTEINMDKFYNKILCKYLIEPDVVGKTNRNLKIMCVSHGAAMREYFGKKYANAPNTPKPASDLRNTQVYEETMTVSGEKIPFGKTNPDADTRCVNTKNETYGLTYLFHGINYEKYKPPLIRTEYENFELSNIDVCQLRGLKGVLHYAIADPTTEKKIISLKTNVSDILHRKGSTELADYVTPDLRFYFKEPDHAKLYKNKSKARMIKGGYYDKYMKYKYKYLQLKQQMNSTKII